MSELQLDNKASQGPFLISFVIPTYKNRIYLEKAIDSVIHQRNEAKINYEIVVTSNYSNDNMLDLVKKYKDADIEIRIYKNEKNLGQVGNINQGILLSRGKYVSFLHDDDMLLDNYLDVISHYISFKDNFDCIIPSMYVMKKNYSFDLKHRFLSFLFAFRFIYRRELKKLSPDDHVLAYDNVYSAPTCGTLFLRDCLINYGLFLDERNAAWDYYNYRCFHKINDVYLLHKYLGIRREFTGMSNESKVQRDFDEDRILMIEKELNNNGFIKKYHDAILYKRPYIKYIWFKFLTRFYFYTHNLDAKIGIPFRLFKLYSDQ